MKLLTGFSLSVLLGLLLAPQRSTATVSTNTACYPPPSGLVGWWPANGSASDIVGSNPGACVGNVQYVSGKVKQAFQFDGSSYVLVSNTPSLNPAGSFSLECWVKPSGAVLGQEMLIGKWGDNYELQNQRSYAVTLQAGGAVGFAISDEAHQWDPSFHIFETPTNAVVPQVWSHVVAVYDQSTGTRRIYVNGVEAAERTDAPITVLNGTAPLAFGAWYRAASLIQDYFTGGLDEVSLYNQALTADEVRALYLADSAGKCAPNGLSVCVPPPSDLVSWWRANGDTSDSAGANPGTVVGNLVYTNGEAGQAFYLDGVNAHVFVPASPSLDVGKGPGLTIEAWVKPDATNVPNPVVEWNNTPPQNGYYYGAQLWLTHPNFGAGNFFANLVDTTGNLSWHVIKSPAGMIVPGVFQHIAVTYDNASGAAVLYYNGSAVTITNLGRFTPQTSYPLYLGQRPPGDANSRTFKGALDEISIYKRALTAEEIQNIYAAGSAGKCFSPVAPSITQQPLSVVTNLGATVGFTVATTGTPPLSYQWFFNGAPLSGGTAPTLTLSNVQLTNAGAYFVVVSNLVKAVTSSNALLTVSRSGGCLPPPAGLVSWWPAEGNALDVVGMNNPSALNGTSFAAGEVGTGFNFNGLNNYVAIGATPPITVGLSNGFTVEGWIKPANLSSSMVIVEYERALGTFSANDVGLDFSVNSHGLGTIDANIKELNQANHEFASSPNVITAGVWQHVAITYDRGAGIAQFYVNGSSVLTTNIGSFTPLTSFTNVLLGGRTTFTSTQYPNTVFAGGMDELSIYNRALRSDEIQAIYLADGAGKCSQNPISECTPPPPGVVSWWRGENNAFDSVGTNNGTLAGNAAYAPGEVGQGFVFDGNADGVNVGAGTNLWLQTFSLEAWIRRASSTVVSYNGNGNGHIFSVGSGGGYGFYLDASGHPTLSKMQVSVVSANTTITDLNWHHIAVTKVGTNVVFYVDGTAYPAPAYDPGFTFGSAAVIGGWTHNGVYDNTFYGAIDELAVYNRALSATEVESIYAAGSAGKCPVTVAAGGCTPPPPGVVSWWRGENNAVDSVGTNNGTLAGNAAYAPGEVGQGFMFDGNADGINVGTGTNLWLQNFSVEAWVKRASTTVLSYNGNGNGHIFSVGSGGGYGFYLDASGRPTLSKLQVSVVNANTSITDLNWHHVAVTKAGTNVTFYVDGTPYPAPAYDPGFTFGSAAVIGGWTHNGVYDNTFYGAIDELAVYNRALSATEVESIYTAGSFGKCFTPVAPAITAQPVSVVTNLGLNAAFTVLATGTPPLSYQWRFNGTNLPGQTANALTLVNLQLTNSGVYSVVVSNQVSVVVSTNALLTVVVPPCTPPPAGILSWWQSESNALDSVDGNMGTLTGNASYGPGRVGRAFVFDGRGDAVNLGTTSNLWLQTFTIETWVKRTSPTVVSYDGNGNGHFFSIGGPGCMAFYYDPTGQPILGQMWYGGVGPGVRITDTNWHHMAVTKSQGAVVFYIDGVAHPAPNYNPTFSFASPSALGGWFYNGTVQNSFYGSIDELAVYNRALSPAEIQGIYNASVIGKCTTPPFIVTQPTGINTIEGSNVTFSVTAGGDPVLHYQWMFNGARIPGATGISLSLTNVQWTNSGAYSVAVANAFGHTVSSNAVLSVDRIPVAQCASVVVAAGSNCTAVASVDQGSYDPDGDPLTLSQSPPAPYALGTNLVTLTVADNRGASNSCTALVVVLDQTPPTLLLPADIVVTNAHNAWTSIVAYAPTAIDNCSGVGQPVCVPPSGSAFSLGTTTVNVSATDAAGNAAHGSFKVTVLPGNVPPVPIIQIAPLAHFPGNTNLLVIAPDNQQAKVVLDGSKSYDVDDTNFLSFWYSGTNLLSTNLVATVVLGLGTNDITLLLDDTFPLGTNSASAQVEVISPAQAVALLEGLLNEPGTVHDGSLVASLNAATAAFKRGDFTAGLNQLQAFENKVSAQVAPEDPALADELSQAAQQILTALAPSVAGGSGKVKFLTFTHQPGKMHLKFAGVTGKAHVVQASTNLRDWTTIGTATDNGDGSFDFEDTKAAGLPARFYRVVEP